MKIIENFESTKKPQPCRAEVFSGLDGTRTFVFVEPEFQVVASIKTT
jgi:hypothetical protein